MEGSKSASGEKVKDKNREVRPSWIKVKPGRMRYALHDSSEFVEQIFDSNKKVKLQRLWKERTNVRRARRHVSHMIYYPHVRRGDTDSDISWRAWDKGTEKLERKRRFKKYGKMKLWDVEFNHSKLLSSSSRYEI